MRWISKERLNHHKESNPVLKLFKTSSVGFTKSFPIPLPYFIDIPTEIVEKIAGFLTDKLKFQTTYYDSFIEQDF